MWEKTTQHDEFQLVEKITEFIYNTASRLSRRNRKKPAINNQDSCGTKSSKVEKNWKGHVFVTIDKNCIACLIEMHLLFKFAVFLKMLINERY